MGNCFHAAAIRIASTTSAVRTSANPSCVAPFIDLRRAKLLILNLFSDCHAPSALRAAERMAGPPAFTGNPNRIRSSFPVADFSAAATSAALPPPLSAAAVAATRAEIDDVIRVRDELKIMFDHDQRITFGHQPGRAPCSSRLISAELRPVVGSSSRNMRGSALPFSVPRRRLEVGKQEAREFEPLGLAAGKRRGGLPELKIAETDRAQRLEAVSSDRLVMRERLRALRRPSVRAPR